MTDTTTARKAAIDKIRLMMKLKEGTSFENEAAAAAALIDKLCEKYKINAEDIVPQVLDDIFKSTKRVINSDFSLFTAVATFYDAKAYLRTNRSEGHKEFRLVGTEGQQIQTELYYQYLKDVMDRECEKAYKAEKVLSELLGSSGPKSSFRTDFRLAFVSSIAQRLDELKKQENRVHEDAGRVKEALTKYKFYSRKSVSASGDGANAGMSSGSSVSLHKQANGSSQRALMGY